MPARIDLNRFEPSGPVKPGSCCGVASQRTKKLQAKIGELLRPFHQGHVTGIGELDESGIWDSVGYLA